MILVDTGPFVALFNPRDGHHLRCRTILKRVREALYTTVPVLTEAFHLLEPASRGSVGLRDFVFRGGVTVWFLDEHALERCFELMEQYSDHPMDLADASLVVAAEVLQTRKVLTSDRDDFSSYRIRIGHRYESFSLLV